MITIKAAVGNFFDSDKVIRAVDSATRKVLSKFGAFVRTRARSSLRKSRKVSKPGSAPSSHVGYVKKFLYFSYEEGRHSVVIGPARISSTVDPMALPALEYGGASTIQDRRAGERRRINVKARPFMGPALKAELPGLPAMWRDSVH